VIAHAQLFACASHSDVKQPPSLLVAASLELVPTKQQDVPSVEPFGAVDGREPHGARQLFTQKEGRWDFLGRDSPAESCFDPRPCEPAGHSQYGGATVLRTRTLDRADVAALGRPPVPSLIGRQARSGVARVERWTAPQER